MLFPGAPVAEAASGAPPEQGPGTQAAPAGKDKEQKGADKAVAGDHGGQAGK